MVTLIEIRLHAHVTLGISAGKQIRDPVLLGLPVWCVTPLVNPSFLANSTLFFILGKVILLFQF